MGTSEPVRVRVRAARTSYSGESSAHPNVEPVEKIRPTAAYMLTLDDQKEFPRYEKLWKEIFQIR